MLLDLEFDEVHRHIFEEEQKSESFVMCFNKERGILLHYMTYDEGVASINLLCNWKPTVDGWYERLSLRCSRVDNNPEILAAGIKINEGLRAKIRQLDTLGEFITPWRKTPNLWLLNQNEIDGVNLGSNESQVISEARLESITDPKVRRIIGLT